MLPSVCFVGYFNLPIIARGYEKYRTGGEEVQQTLLAKAFARRGYRTSMVIGDYGQAEGLQVDGITLFKTYAPAAGIPVFRFLHPRWTSLWSALKRADADAYYVSPAGAQLGQVAMFTARHQRRLIFRIAHDANCNPATLMIQYWRDRQLYSYGLRRANTILAQTNIQQQSLKQHYRLESTVAAMMVEGAARQLEFGQRDVDVLWVNNLRAFKRPELYLDLALQLPTARMHMVGGPSPGFDALFRSLSERVPTIANLSYHGRVPYHDVNDLYERARAFVNTSDTEGFPNSYLQAWVRGTPVVAFFDPDGVIAREGLGSAVSNLGDMRAAVTRLLQDPQHWSETSARCRNYMQLHYNEEHIMAPYLQAMAEIS